VPGRVDEVDLAALPVEVEERAGERHRAPVLVLVPVGDRAALLDRAEPRRLSRLEEQRLHERGLPDPAVTDDGDVADLPGLEGRHQAGVLRCVASGAHRTPVERRDDPGSRRERGYSGARAPAAASRALRRRIAFVWSWETRDSVTPSTSPISRRVSSS